MAKYTQTLYEYMDNLGLDPFNEDDLIKAGRTLLTVEYDVPKEVMDNLLQRFVIRYIDNEIGFYDIKKFRLHLMRYAIEQRPKYEKMYNLFENMNPFEYINQVKEREMSQSVKDDILKELKRELESVKNGVSNTDAERTNINTRTEREGVIASTNQNVSESGTLNENINNTTNKSGNSKETTVGSENKNESVDGNRIESGSENKTGNNNETQTKSGTDVITNENRDAEGFGSINSFAEPGIMINGTTIGNGTQSTQHGVVIDTDTTIDEKTSTDRNITDDTTTKTNGSSSNEITGRQDEIQSDIGSKSERDKRDSKRIGSDTRNTDTSAQMSGRGENKSKTTDEEIRNSNTKENERREGNKETTGTEIETISGLIQWKPELAKEFYNTFIVVDEEWVRGARDLFSYIY